MVYRTIGPRGLALIKSYEKLMLRAYQDGGGVWTIGYGHTRNAHPGDIVTEAQAEILLQADLANAINAVDTNVKVDLRESQRDALISLAFNAGSLGPTMLKLLNARDYVGAAAEFAKWHWDNGKRVRGLLRRRAAEMLLFLED